MKNAIYATLICLTCLLPEQTKAQCTWTNYFFDSFEYTTVIPHIVPGMTYQNTPQTFPGCIHSGAFGLYLNIADGQSGLIYDQPFTNLCVGANYRFSFWTKDAWGASNNLTFEVLSSANVVLSTQTVITNGAWANIVMPAFTATTSSIQFRIITNTPGGPGNDAALDDLTLSICSPNQTTTPLTQCAGAGTLNLYNQLVPNNLSGNGTWSGPSVLQNGYLGTFTEGSNLNGLYSYTIDGGGSCPDSVAHVQVQIVSTPTINPLGPITACGSYTLPVITGTSLTGNQHYYTGPNGTGTLVNTGSNITSSQTLYMYAGIPGCSDNELVNITISAPVTAGNDNSGSFCGTGPTINLNSFLAANASGGGTWSETTSPPSGTMNASGNWDTDPLTSGTYTFQYTVAANGACPADVANFTMIIGNVPSVDLGNDTILCSNQSLWLNAGTYDTYQWNNGSTNATKYVSQPGGTYWVKVGTLGANQIVNGGFESGNTGFNTQYTAGVGGPWGLLSNPGTYAITTSPNLVHSNFSSCQDHTPNPGVNQMVVNGASTPNTEVWCQTIPVQPNTTYQFGTWVSAAVTDPTVAQLQFTINNSQLGPIFSPSAQGCSWTQFTQNWMSGLTTSAEICIVNQNTSGGGNDFALDDITFRPICYSTDTIVVSYSQPPVVNLGPDQFHCAGTSVTLDAQNPGLDYLWSTTETTQTIAPTVSGNYSVTVTTPQNCSASDNITITFEDPLNAGNDSAVFICSTENQFDLSTLLDNAAAAGGSWESNTPSFAGTLSAQGLLTLTGQSGIFDFSYIVQGTYCANDTADFTLTIQQQPVAAPDQTIHLCNTVGDQVDFTPFLTHPFAPIAGSWDVPANLPNGYFDEAGNLLDLSGLPHGMYLFDYILPSEPGCIPDTLSVDVTVTAVPVVQFSSDVEDGCQPLQVTFINESIVQGNVTYSWDLGDGTTSGSTTTLDNQYEAATCYDVTLTVTADGLCTSTLSLNDMICVYPLPVADFYFGPQQVFSDGPVVTFTNTSTNNDLNAWNFGDNFTSNAENPEHTFPIGEIGNYDVELIVTTFQGCSDTTHQIIVVKDQLLFYVPNTFTPDGDQYNSVFIPVMTSGMDPHDYSMEIYNRWGEQVFYTTDINEGWDGTYKGNSVQEGTYTWKLQFGLVDTDEDKEIIGHVNLIR